ncbi:MAG TPA: hypothetical protein VL172_03945, partial [Kofleriaceae bacterium]|nr:hypothetical protein [Kofleriaceae bacterium]
MITRTRLLPLLLLAACGGGGGSTDAGVDSGGGNPDAMLAACAEFDSPAGTISSYPGSFTGDLVGAGADLSAPIGRCTDERDWYDPAGEDQVVHLTGLTAGTLYGVILDSDADMSFYVATGCGDGEPLAGACLVFVDTEIGGGEVAEFTGPASGEAYLVIDNFDTGLADPDGGYTVTVLPAECTDNTGCTDVAKPLCFNYQCVECVSSLDCSDSGAPACDDTNTCVASLDECTNDDVSEPDDGPADATVIAEPTAGAPTLAFNSICNTPDGEGDWFELTVADDTELGFSLTWAPSSGADLDVYIWDANGEFVDGGLNFGTDAEAVRVALTAGVYHLQVDYFEPKDVTEALEYVLTVGVPECEDSFDCLDSSNTVCNAAG